MLYADGVRVRGTRPIRTAEFLESFAAFPVWNAQRLVSRALVSYKRGGTRRVVLHLNSRGPEEVSVGSIIVGVPH